MSLRKIYAQLACRSLSVSRPWFEQLFGRAPDAAPMQGLLEWHHGDGAGFQLFENPEHAGSGTLTIIVQGLAEEHGRVAGLKPGKIEKADYVDLIRLEDPDENLVVLAEPRG